MTGGGAADNIGYHFDDALREVPADPVEMARAVAALQVELRATNGDDRARARLLGRLGPFLRILGRLDDAATVLMEAVDLCATRSDERDLAANRLRLAHVYQWQRRFDLSDPLFMAALAQCESEPAARPLLPFAWQHLGKDRFDQGRFAEAAAHFARALALRRREGDANLIASSAHALAVAEARLREGGCGPSDALNLLVARLLSAEPLVVRSVYVEGSQADGTALPTSDLDLLIVLEAGIDKGARDAIGGIITAVARQTDCEIDAEIASVASLMGGVAPMLKLASRLVWGAPVLDDLPIVPLDTWTRDRMHTSYWRIGTLFPGRARRINLPLDYPDPADEFFGYCRRTVRSAAGEEVPSTRDLVRHVGWMATALVAFHARRYVVRKRDCHRVYGESIGDHWSTLIADIYRRCRGEWGYVIPEDAADRAALRTICARTLSFEAHFLAAYRDFLVRELLGGDATARASIIDVFERLPLPDAEVAALLEAAPIREVP